MNITGMDKLKVGDVIVRETYAPIGTWEHAFAKNDFVLRTGHFVVQHVEANGSGYAVDRNLDTVMQW